MAIPENVKKIMCDTLAMSRLVDEFYIGVMEELNKIETEEYKKRKQRVAEIVKLYTEIEESLD